MTRDARRAPPPIPARSWALAAVTGAGAFMAMLDATVVNLALERIGAGFGAALADVQWVMTGYLCALAVALPATAWLGRRFGQATVWRASLALFLLASVLCALAPSLPLLVAARVLQGLAGGVMVPSGQAVIAAAVERTQLGRLMGTLGFAVALGPALGPAAGGALLAASSWPALFWINVPVGALALLASLRLLPAGERGAAGAFDWTGLALLAGGLPLLFLGASGAAREGSGHAELALVAGAALVLAASVHTTRARQPLVRVRLLRSAPFAAAVATAALAGANMYGGLLLLPIWLHDVLQQDVTRTGWMLFVLGLGSACVLPLAGAWTDRWGGGRVSAVGAAVLALSLLPLLLPALANETVLACALAIRGAALALAQMPAVTAAYTAVAKEDVGDAATLVNIAQRLGAAFGAGAVAFMAARPTAAGAADLDGATAVLLALSVLGLLSALAMHVARQRGA